LEADVGNPVVLEFQINREPVAAEAIVTVRVPVGIRHGMKVPRFLAVIEN
jgi:hypothetical protein